MLTDDWGNPLSTGSTTAAAAIQDATTSFIGWRTDTMEHISAAIAADPDFALPYALRGLMMTGLRKPELHGKARECLVKAQSVRPAESPRERAYIAALAATLDGRITEAAAAYESAARDHPLDLFALRLAQFELFWIGEVAWMRDISERAAPHWSRAVPGFGGFQAIRAFGLEETGDYGLAEACGREAVQLDPTDCWGTHAVAHVLVMQGRLAEGAAFVSGQKGNWGAANHIRHHLWWHLALFEVERGEYDAALEIYDERLRDLTSPLMQAVPDFYVDLQNDVALLQRLELRGIDVGDRWEPVADLAEDRIGNHASPFTSPHAALALAAAGRMEKAEAALGAMRAFVAEDGGVMAARYALAALPAAEAAVAYRRGDYAGVLACLLPARRNLWQMGGSHAQRDLFFQILAHAALRLERRDVLHILFEELQGIGLEHLEERTSYADALAAIH
ncbi:MAG: tetratricopeptide repeat protein [Pseudomonadota bacterium]